MSATRHHASLIRLLDKLGLSELRYARLLIARSRDELRRRVMQADNKPVKKP